MGRYLFSASGKANIAVGIVIGAFLLAGAFYFSSKEKSSVEECIKSMLPKEEHVGKIKRIKGGFSNDLWQVDTEKKCYIFRSPKKKDDPSHFVQLLEICKCACENGICPQIVAENVQEQQLLLECIEHVPWPSFKENPEPYMATMNVLRCFHEKMQPLLPKMKGTSYAPFTFIFDEGQSLEEAPVHFSIALKKVELIFERLEPWLKNHATLCHGDLHERNVLLSKNKERAPILIDLDSIASGDPFFDVVKFSISFSPKDRLEMFKEYLGGRLPTLQEQAHFELMDLTLLMVIASVRFKSAQEAQGDSCLSKAEIEELLNTEESLPSFLEIPFDDTSPKARQLGATYALAEFLKRSNAPSFNGLIALTACADDQD